MELYCPVCDKEYPLETHSLFCPERKRRAPVNQTGKHCGIGARISDDINKTLERQQTVIQRFS